MVFSQQLNNGNRILKRLAKALIRLRVCAVWSEALLVAHTTLLEISCTGSNVIYAIVLSDRTIKMGWMLNIDWCFLFLKLLQQYVCYIYLCYNNNRTTFTQCQLVIYYLSIPPIFSSDYQWGKSHFRCFITVCKFDLIFPMIALCLSEEAYIRAKHFLCFNNSSQILGIGRFGQ